MCLIVEHARAKQRIAELELKNTEFKEKYEPILPADYPTFDIGWYELVTELKQLGIELMLKPEYVPDAKVKYTDEASWTQIMPFLVYPADYYVDQVADCDDYSRWAASDCSRLFKMNGCLQCWGSMPLGYHAFNLVKTDGGYKIFEPNAAFHYAGELMEFGQNGYVPQSWR